MRIDWREVISRLKALRFDPKDAFVLGGLAAVAKGLHDIYPPAAWLVVGVFFVFAGMR